VTTVKSTRNVKCTRIVITTRKLKGGCIFNHHSQKSKRTTSTRNYDHSKNPSRCSPFLYNLDYDCDDDNLLVENMKRQSQRAESNNDSFNQGSVTGTTPPTTTTELHQRHLLDVGYSNLQRQDRAEKNRFELLSSRLWPLIDGRISPVKIQEKCTSIVDSVSHVPCGESTSVSFSLGLYQSFRTWVLRKGASQLLGVQSYDRVLSGKEATSETIASSLEPLMSPEPLPLGAAALESEDPEHAYSHGGDLSLSSDSHLRVSIPQGDFSLASSLSIASRAAYLASEDKESSVASDSQAALEGDANNAIRAAALSLLLTTSSWKDTESFHERDSHRSDASSSVSSDYSTLDGWCPSPLVEDGDDSSSQEIYSDGDDDYSVSSYASSCTETTLTPSTISTEGARSLEVRWCRVEHTVIHPLMATLFNTLAVPNMECVTFHPLQCLVLNAVDGRIAVRLQTTLALHQKSYLMDCVLPPRLVVLGQGIDWCSDDDFEDWLYVSERFSYSHHHEYISEY
jgi:hypothetical protein